jgi:hypothetical protein
LSQLGNFLDRLLSDTVFPNNFPLVRQLCHHALEASISSVGIYFVLRCYPDESGGTTDYVIFLGWCRLLMLKIETASSCYNYLRLLY